MLLFSYHALLDLQYESWLAKTATVEKLAWEMGIFVREAERHLDANLFLDEYMRWESGGPHHPYILQWMFAHMETAGGRSMIVSSTSAADSLCLSETQVWRLPPLSS